MGRPALERAIRRAGCNPLRLTPYALGLALPEIEQVLRAFLSPETAEARLAAIARLART